jgi:hypothetical protein
MMHRFHRQGRLPGRDHQCSVTRQVAAVDPYVANSSISQLYLHMLGVAVRLRIASANGTSSNSIRPRDLILARVMTRLDKALRARLSTPINVIGL